jgi:hypothetical protein
MRFSLSEANACGRHAIHAVADAELADVVLAPAVELAARGDAARELVAGRELGHLDTPLDGGGTVDRDVVPRA